MYEVWMETHSQYTSAKYPCEEVNDGCSWLCPGTTQNLQVASHYDAHTGKTFARWPWHWLQVTRVIITNDRNKMLGRMITVYKQNKY
ncbi:hypothetical protein PAXRUDRAFT_825755 [Paxillus rubicundulus Ve08.2h10]|uniref:Uncharacterized protein n=1 Tax=Paxillus rubicundulus Ve08.2h10 TaxID=930991 RepID=A0A0D0E076_9AGAM|nr:hypothetical protein PAXRUDRAFT_825755 [Paxillus rubicundulus Ve08.2h10]